MPEELEISVAPEILDEGSPEERAAFGLFTIRSLHSNSFLTEGFDYFLNGYRPGPLVSGYHAAEWFTWNWWRLRWEPQSEVPDWPFAHQMTSIGEGYVWPNVTIFSDGVRTALISSPSTRPDAKPFRYVGAPPLIVPSKTFEAAVDAFIPRVLGRLREQGVPETNLDRLWRDVLAERSDPKIAVRRRLEALLGRDPDAVDDDAVDRLLADAARLGEQSVDELAAEAARGAEILTADEFRKVAREHGCDSSDAVRLGSDYPLTKGPNIPAWRVGAEAAKALRDQESLGAERISNAKLAEIGGTQEAIITDRQRVGDSLVPFVLDQGARKARVVLRSRWEAGRRFELARLIGDRLMVVGGALHPATRTHTYRQKAQRSFAAELLSPFEVVDEMLGNDYSMEKRQEVAEWFAVSPMMIDNQLKNHGKIEREGWDFECPIAA